MERTPAPTHATPTSQPPLRMQRRIAALFAALFAALVLVGGAMGASSVQTSTLELQAQLARLGYLSPQAVSGVRDDLTR